MKINTIRCCTVETSDIKLYFVYFYTEYLNGVYVFDDINDATLFVVSKQQDLEKYISNVKITHIEKELIPNNIFNAYINGINSGLFSDIKTHQLYINFNTHYERI